MFNGLGGVVTPVNLGMLVVILGVYWALDNEGRIPRAQVRRLDLDGQGLAHHNGGGPHPVEHVHRGPLRHDPTTGGRDLPVGRPGRVEQGHHVFRGGLLHGHVILGGGLGEGVASVEEFVIREAMVGALWKFLAHPGITAPAVMVQSHLGGQEGGVQKTEPWHRTSAVDDRFADVVVRPTCGSDHHAPGHRAEVVVRRRPDLAAMVVIGIFVELHGNK